MEHQHPQRLYRDANLETRMPVEPGIHMKRPRPVTSCTHCGATGHSSQLSNVRCAHTMNGKRCRGRIRVPPGNAIGISVELVAHLGTKVRTSVAFVVVAAGYFSGDGQESR